MKRHFKKEKKAFIMKERALHEGGKRALIYKMNYLPFAFLCYTHYCVMSLNNLSEEG